MMTNNNNLDDWKASLEPQTEEWIVRKARENSNNGSNCSSICYSYICEKSNLSERLIEKLMFYTSDMYDPKYGDSDKYIDTVCLILEKCGNKGLQFAVVKDIVFNNENYLDELFIHNLVNNSYCKIFEMLDNSNIPDSIKNLLRHGTTEELTDYFGDILNFYNKRTKKQNTEFSIRKLRRHRDKYDCIFNFNTNDFINPDVSRLIAEVKNAFSNKISDKLDWWALDRYQNVSDAFRNKYKKLFAEGMRVQLQENK